MSGFIKKTDTAFIQQNQKDGQPVGYETVLVRRVSGTNVGNPTNGIQPTLIYKTKKTKAVIVRLTPEEIVSSAGIYQYGDLKVDLIDELNFIDERSGEIGDRMIYQRQTYRIVGRTQNQAIEGRSVFYTYIMRKVGNDTTIKYKGTISSDSKVV
jgi:hypothetical protein